MNHLRPIAIALVLLAALVAWHARVAAQTGKLPENYQPSEPAVAGEALDPQVPAIPSKNLLEIIQAGGILMIPIFFCSVLTLVFVLERSMALRRGRVIPGPFVKRFLHQLGEGELDRETALQLCLESKSPVAEVFAGAVRKWGKPAVEVEQAILDQGERAANGLRRYVRVFNGVATLGPLLGLLGTVFGMIRAFNEIASSDAMGRPELLAAGISEALITTAAGLSVAIPALSCYLFFISRVDQLIVRIDGLGQEIVGMISAEALQERPQSKPSRSRSREAA
ncbi:MAG TPA: MotA/TolQ/ExbB proton channel family protein [Pirellulales bacterium]|jgi:biopolymer transport protein ExbB|nr:MotA/TolQ/ExbB proton channel family protein [Pirellulales bacterium]